MELVLKQQKLIDFLTVPRSGCVRARCWQVFSLYLHMVFPVYLSEF